MTEFIINWDQIAREEWDRLLTQADYSSFQQAWAYGALFNKNKLKVSRFVAYEGGKPIAMGQIVIRRFLGLFKLALMLRGPVWIGYISDDRKQEILSMIRQRYPLKYFNLFAFSPNEDEQHYGVQGFKKIITGYSTILVDLKLSEDVLWQNLYSKNRTHIRKAQKSDFAVVIGDHNHPHTDWLLRQEKKQQKQKKYQGLPVGLVMGYGQYSLHGVITAFAVKDGENEPIAGALCLCHGNSATYHIGWNGKEGRKCRALNLLLWQMILKLKQDGYEVLDLGGLNTEEGADIARYKLGFSGKVIKLAGTYM